MSKKLTQEDIIKKHQTNVKSAQGVFALAGVLGIIYIVRYFITGNFDFYFSLSFTEILLRKLADESISSALGYSLIGIFIAAYLIVTVVISKKTRQLHSSLGLYMLDFAFLIVHLIIRNDIFTSDRLIDVILHIFVIMFLIVGVKSEKALRES